MVAAVCCQERASDTCRSLEARSDLRVEHPRERPLLSNTTLVANLRCECERTQCSRMKARRGLAWISGQGYAAQGTRCPRASCARKRITECTLAHGCRPAVESMGLPEPQPQPLAAATTRTEHSRENDGDTADDRRMDTGRGRKGAGYAGRKL